MGRAIRLLVVDDHPVYRDGLIAMLRATTQEIETVGVAGDGASAVQLAAETKPDVVLMDVKMAGVDGIEATRQIRQRLPGVRVIALSAFDDDDHVLGMIKAGASGYMLKDADHTTIVSGIKAAHAGQARIHPRLTAQVFRAFASLATHGHRPGDLYDGLTAREVQVLELVAQGYSNRKIAEQLWISERTVDNHVQNVYRKLDIRDRTQAALYAVRKGLVSARGADRRAQRTLAGATRR